MSITTGEKCQTDNGTWFELFNNLGTLDPGFYVMGYPDDVASGFTGPFVTTGDAYAWAMNKWA